MGFFRLFLALSVLLGHTRGHGFFGLSFLFPELAVQSFFLISGFYMALVLNEKYHRPGQYRLFLTQRFLRLYPTYAILCVAFLAIDGAMGAITGQAFGTLKTWHDHGHLLSPGAVTFLLIENVVVLGQDVVMLLRMHPVTGAFYAMWTDGTMKPIEPESFLMIGASWTLALEFYFYLIAPFLVRRAWRVQLALAAVCLLLRLAIYESVPVDPHHWIYCLFPPNLVFFLAGSLGYQLYRNFGPQLRAIGESKPWLLVLFGLFAIDYCRYPEARQLDVIWLPLLVVVVPMLFALTCRSRLDRLVGELSYPCYLLHLQVLMFTLPLLAPPARQWMIGPLSIGITLVLSYLYYRFVELRTERYRESLYQQSQHRIDDPGAVVDAPPATLTALDYTNKPS
jgi:peptidoglycan/LPS O-acetylase OafA/YrhL